MRQGASRDPGALPRDADFVDDVGGDPKVRLGIVEAWEDMPDLVTANQGEPGIVELCDLLLSRGVGIEAGLLSSDDARAFVRSGLSGRCRRVLIEPLDADPDAAVRHAASMEDIVVSAGSRWRRCTTATASRVGPSIDGDWLEAMASGPGWRT